MSIVFACRVGTYQSGLMGIAATVGPLSRGLNKA
jgi:hypothetical protein